MTPSTATRSKRTMLAQGLGALALAAPATALAAPGDEPDPIPPKVKDFPIKEALNLKSGPDEQVLAKVAAIDIAGRAPEPKQGGGKSAKSQDGPFHPIIGEVGYGDEIAAFGHARGRPHQGQDIFAPAGTPLISPTKTVVLETGSDGGRGNWIALYDPAADQTYNYFHMVGPAEVAAGDRLRAGQKVGEVGCTGSCSGDHLHLEIREGKGPYGTAIDPMPVIKDWKPFKK